MNFKYWMENNYLSDRILYDKIENLQNHIIQNPTDLDNVQILGDLYEDLSRQDRHTVRMSEFCHNCNFKSNNDIFTITKYEKINFDLLNYYNQAIFSDEYNKKPRYINVSFNNLIKFYIDDGEDGNWICTPSYNKDNFCDCNYKLQRNTERLINGNYMEDFFINLNNNLYNRIMYNLDEATSAEIFTEEELEFNCADIIKHVIFWNTPVGRVLNIGR